MARELYIFIQLPQSIATVVAGLFALEENIEPAVGRFVYARSYLEREEAVPLDPVALPLSNQEFVTTFNRGYFGVLRDSMPDAWGRHVVAALGVGRIESDFDYLLLPAGDRVGALRFGKDPATPIIDEPVAHSARISQALIAGLSKIADEQPLTALEREAVLAAGGATTAGGARPKFTLEDGGALWLVKLPRNDDKWNYARAESAMLDLAAECGIEVPEHDVRDIGGRQALFVKRFDRVLDASGVLRHRVVSAATVFCADETYYRFAPQGSYMRLARELERWTTNVTQERRELFRRVAFNCLAGVTDDHERNHALLAEGTHFRLAPAFDLVPQPGNTQRRFLSLIVGDFGSAAARQNLISSSDAFGLSVREANGIIDAIQAAVRANWRKCCADRGVTETDVSRIEACFDPPFFESELPPNAVM